MAFGGVYSWAVVIIGLAAAAVIATLRPRLPPSDRVLDTSLLVALGVCALHLLPLPLPLIRLVSGNRVALWGALSLGPPPAWLTLSLSPGDTLHALAVFAAAVFSFFGCRAVLAVGGARRICRGIAWLGFAVACEALIQRVLSPALIYGFWQPQDAGATPFGPFVNRNHAAGWLVMAVSLCAGYSMTRTGSGEQGRVRLRLRVNERISWLLVTFTMVLALSWSLSRSGMAGIAAAATVLTVCALRRGSVATLRLGGVLGVTAVAALVIFGDLPAGLKRIGDGLGGGAFDRATIWRDTWPLVSDFWLFGTGPGTYRTAMLHYQTSSHAYIFNQAHNHPLQVLAEGGIVLAMPVGAAIGALIVSAVRQLRRDATGMFWIRAGAAAGLAGIAVQSFWETGLRVPALGHLAAVLAALVLHQPEASRPLGNADARLDDRRGVRTGADASGTRRRRRG